MSDTGSVTFTDSWLSAQACPECGHQVKWLRGEWHLNKIAGESVEYGMVQMRCDNGHQWSRIPE